jgi:single-strand DNA-binding protein
MARGFNKVVLMGNLARDPELRYTVDKRAWARFTVAVGYSWKNKNGELQNEVDFIPVVVWGPRAETCGRYLKKGSAVLVEGKIKVRSYEAKDGSGKRYSTDVAADEVMFVGSKRSDGD